MHIGKVLKQILPALKLTLTYKDSIYQFHKLIMDKEGIHPCWIIPMLKKPNSNPKVFRNLKILGYNARSLAQPANNYALH